MRAYQLLQAASVVGGTLMTCSVSLADNCSGHDVLVNRFTEATEVANGHTLTTMIDYSVVTSDDYRIVDATTGECAATMLTFPDGNTKVSGHCVRRDKDGDSYSVEFSSVPGTAGTAWKVIAGTGKFTGNASSGRAQSVVHDGKIILVKWTGTCK
ncbi:hypothetical protein [Nitrosomonas sp. Nm166]|uniref:hypothetical protein n=1 Tax=Nitrosomonas sp. Nm166 TaxID=1881054 RepID=UPI0008F2BB00|nr:hypothetical protein [Nitrosomonas sp. Nm166]SFE03636.1 hypothetical protein SAMN05428977_100543 [Nitrosomonas sp. Nm166]